MTRQNRRPKFDVEFDTDEGQVSGGTMTAKKRKSRNRMVKLPTFSTSRMPKTSLSASIHLRNFAAGNFSSDQMNLNKFSDFSSHSLGMAPVLK